MSFQITFLSAAGAEIATANLTMATLAECRAWASRQVRQAARDGGAVRGFKVSAQ